MATRTNLLTHTKRLHRQMAEQVGGLKDRQLREELSAGLVAVQRAIDRAPDYHRWETHTTRQ